MNKPTSVQSAPTAPHSNASACRPDRHALLRKYPATPGILLCALLLSGCAGSASNGIGSRDLTPQIGSTPGVLRAVSPVERTHLQLIATSMVATLMQIPDMRGGDITLQINTPKTAYGHALVKALEDAGFGLQLVSADQGQHYLSYSKRLSETESGLVTDYALSVGRISLRREFSVSGQAIYPSSLLTTTGVDSVAEIVLHDDIFIEQGGDSRAFISGLQREGEPDPNLSIRTVDIREFDALPLAERTQPDEVFRAARSHAFSQLAQRTPPPLQRLTKHRRTVLIFDNNATEFMGTANKQAMRLLAREFNDNDIMLIKACQDADGVNQASMQRAQRVGEELNSLGVSLQQTYIAPCARTSYRHTSDDSPAPVELVHYRR